MENKTQVKEVKRNKKKSKSAEDFASVRISQDSKKKAKALLKDANEKNFGRSVKFDELVELALGLVTPEHLKVLQNRSLTNEDRKEILRQKYIALHGPITQDEFTGFMMTDSFQEFLREQSQIVSAA